MLVAAVAASASTWFYANRILRAQQIADAALHHQPRGNFSDLYPRWLGARELLKHGRNPYSPEITREIQQGYFGRTLDPMRADDPRDQQAFAYPVYVVFLLAPTVDLPFDTVQTVFRCLLIGLTAVTVFLWLKSLRWRPPFATTLILIVLMLGWLPMVQGIKLQQLSLLVAALLAACAACLSGGWLFLAGGLLALSTTKPQLAWPAVLWLLLWAGCDWRSRRRFVTGFVLMMLLLLAGAQFALPGWFPMFLHAIREYSQYTQSQSVLGVLFGTILSHILEALSVLVCALSLWRVRREPASSAAFGSAFALLLALTVLIVPKFAPYNQVLLAPALLVLLRQTISGEPILPAVRLARVVCGIFLLWPWIATLALSAGFLWLTPEIRQRVYLVPFYSLSMLPLFVFGLALLGLWMNHAADAA
jgi:hypothetical protein